MNIYVHMYVFNKGIEFSKYIPIKNLFMFDNLERLAVEGPCATHTLLTPKYGPGFISRGPS